MKKERATTSDEQRERMLIAEQIERAAAEKGRSDSPESPPEVEEGLKRDEGANKLVLSFTPKAPVLSTSMSTSSPPASASTSSISLSAKSKPVLGLKVNPLKSTMNPLKRPNVFKQASTTPSAPVTPLSAPPSKKRDLDSMTAAERLIFEDQERKRRKTEREAAA